MAIQQLTRSWRTRLGLGFALALSTLGMGACDDAGGSGFALSLKPFFTDADLESDPSLPGLWTDKEDDVTFTFEQQEGKEYKVVVKETEDGHTSSADFEGHLLRLGGYWFLDLIPKEGQAGGTFYQMHLLRAHSLARIDVTRDSMKMSFLEASWLQKKIGADTGDISYQKSDGTLLLTGPSDQVRDLAFQASHDDSGFSDAITLDRDQTKPER
jgi:hypothetical protein